MAANGFFLLWLASTLVTSEEALTDFEWVSVNHVNQCLGAELEHTSSSNEILLCNRKS